MFPLYILMVIPWFMVILVIILKSTQLVQYILSLPVEGLNFRITIILTRQE